MPYKLHFRKCHILLQWILQFYPANSIYMNLTVLSLFLCTPLGLDSGSLHWISYTRKFRTIKFRKTFSAHDSIEELRGIFFIVNVTEKIERSRLQKIESNCDVTSYYIDKLRLVYQRIFHLIWANYADFCLHLKFFYKHLNVINNL